MMTEMKRIFSLVATLFVASVFTLGLGFGCQSKLETGGAYAPGIVQLATNSTGQVTTNAVAFAAPDKAFYAVDAAFELAYGTYDIVAKFEKNNRAILWRISPNIKHSLDAIRPDALDAARRYSAARKAYVSHPTPAGLTALQTILSQMQNLSNAAKAALPS